MKKEDVIRELTEDEANGNGEILDRYEDYYTYFDNCSDVETTYRFEESCDDDYVKSLIKIGEGATKSGLTADYIIDVLKHTFGNDYYDAICTLAGTIIPSNETEFKTMLNEVNRTSDDLDEWYNYDEQENCVGRMFHAHQIVFIHEALIREQAKELCDEIFSEDEEYQTGIVITLLHEMRHLMLDTNAFISEDKIPLSEQVEDAVENFARNAYEHLGSLTYWK